MIFLITKILTMSFSGFAFTLNSQTDPNLKGWNTKSLGFELNVSNCPSGTDGIIKEAMKVWNNVATANLEVKLAGNTSSTTYSNPPTIYCSTTFAATTGADANVVPGAGSIGTSGGRIVQGLLILNVQPGAQANIANYDSTLLKIILAHEIGHVIGLGHSEFEPALMYYSVGSKAHMRLSQDDIAGITYLYPRNELSGDGLLGCGQVGRSDIGLGIGRRISGFSWALFFLILTAPLALAASARRRLVYIKRY